MINKEELDLEQKYLKKVSKTIKQNLLSYKLKLKSAEQEFKDTREYLSLEFNHIDDEEKAEVNQTLEQICYRIDFISSLLNRGERQKSSPYFAKINFETGGEAEDFYIGLYNLFNENQYPLVCDWRAPISSLYYDFECGDAHFIAPDGKVEGKLNSKRQFKIEDGELKLCFDTSLAIQDDILIETLAKTTSNQMRNIVATIQNEQNDIIREDIYKSLLVQGVAGSGKTSIALHRVAYLLYNNRDTLSSNDITILSPNKVFSKYIASVLPELGEQNINQITFDEFVNEELQSYLGRLETRESMINDILTNEVRRKTVEIKNSFEFFDKLKQFTNSYFDLEFEASDVILGEEKISKDVINNLYHNLYKDKKPSIRIEWITDYILDRLNINKNTEDIAKRIKKVLYPMFSSIDMIDIYRTFCENQGIDFICDDIIHYEDISPLLYIKDYILGIAKQSDVKYLVIDEMQDYSPIFMYLITEIYDCKKLIVGDIYQTIEKELDENYLSRLADLLGCQLKVLKRSYRSSYEISEEEEKLLDITINKVARHGNKPVKLRLKDKDEIASYIEKYLNDFADYKHIAIITKDEQSSKNLLKLLGDGYEYNLVSHENQNLEKYNIVPLSYAKGLEFDACIIYDFNYEKNENKRLKYIAISRALHELIIIN